MIDFDCYYLFFYVFIIYFLHNVEFYCVFLMDFVRFIQYSLLIFVIFDFLTSEN